MSNKSDEENTIALLIGIILLIWGFLKCIIMGFGALSGWISEKIELRKEAKELQKLQEQQTLETERKKQELLQQKQVLLAEGYDPQHLVELGRQYVDLIALSILKVCIKYEKVLKTKYKQLVYCDDYGEKVLDDFLKELNSFIKRFVCKDDIFPEVGDFWENLLDKVSIWFKILEEEPDDGLRTLLVYNSSPTFLFCMRLCDDENDIVWKGEWGLNYCEDTTLKDEFIEKIADGTSFEDVESESVDAFVEFTVIYFVFLFLDNPELADEWRKKFDIEEINPPVKKITSPFEYEKNIADKLKELDFNTQVTKASGDQGVDVLADKNEISFAIQCKMYSSPVGNKAVQEVVAGREYYHCNYGVVVTNTSFTKSARQLANTNNVILLNDNELENLLEYIK